MLALFLGFASSALHTLHEERGFLNWMRSTNQYFTGDEYHFRLGIYLSNSRYIAEFNKDQSKSFRIAHNKFSCYTPTEYKTLLGYIPSSTPSKRPEVQAKKSVSLPDSVDWREKNVVNAIKDQGQCGSCWAFSTCCTCESQYALSTGQLLSYSEQNLVDCVTLSYGCSGGNPRFAIEYVAWIQFGKFNSEEDYPYTATDGTCSFDSSKGIGHVNSYKSVSYTASETALQEVIANEGVASVCIDASESSFQLYTSGVYESSGCSTILLNHAVACVGYGTLEGKDYWIVRNSWGEAWGEAGYIKLLRGSNTCGIASQAIIATV